MADFFENPSTPQQYVEDFDFPSEQAPAPVESNTFEVDASYESVPQQQQQYYDYSEPSFDAVSSVPVSAPIPAAPSSVLSPLRAFEIERERALEARIHASTEKRIKIQQAASTDMAQLYEERRVKNAGRAKANRDAQQEFIADRDATLAAGGSNQWEKIINLIDVRTDKTAGGKDLARFRSILQRCKITGQ